MENIIVVEVNVSELIESETYESIGEVIDKMEELFPDSSVYYDAELSAHIDSLLYNGMDMETIEKLNGAIYGSYIEFYELKDFGGYIMEIGVR